MALIYQVSLNGYAYDARNKTWDQIYSETGCKPRTGWKDPLLDRTLLKGEFGCSVSHMRVWQKIADSGINGIILEEDAVFSEINPHHVDHKLEDYDSVWLGYRWNSLGYWYNCHAYAISPDTANLLLEGFSQSIIPVDEWIPEKLKDKRNYFYPKEVVTQIPRETRPSTIEETEMLPEEDINMHIVTVATDPSKAWALYQSANHYGVEVHNLGKNSDWYDPMEGHAGMPKIDMMIDFLKDLPSSDIVLFLDGYDTFFVNSPLEILERFKGFGVDVLFGAEDNFWPPEEFLQKQFDRQHPEEYYKYLNSGCYIGRADALYHLFTEKVAGDTEDDQRYCQLRYLARTPPPEDAPIQWKWDRINFPYKIALDHEAYIFQNHDNSVTVQDRQMYGAICCPCVYHGNGGQLAKDKFLKLAAEFGYKEPQPVAYLMTLDYEEVAPEILVTPFLTERQCQWLIDKSERVGGWGELQGDKFPAQEIRLKKLGFWEEYENLWKEKLAKIAMQHWQPYAHIGLRDAFTMRYSMATQKDLGWHTDASLVTGSVKLNDNYEGATLIFPRQEFTNIDVPVGHCILFPSDVTHGHYVDELQSGTKYSLTMWTSRYEGDVND